MTGVQHQAGEAVSALFPAVAEMVRAALRDYGEWACPITPNARLDGDLRMESVEAAALDALLRERWGTAGDLTALVRGLDLDQLAALTVGDVAAEVERRLAGAGAVRP